MRKIFLLTIVVLSFGKIKAQTNIDFETGTLSNWTFFNGTSTPITVTTPTAPLSYRHTLTSGSGTDPYGGFPVVDPQFHSNPSFPSCPDSNNYSFKLGNDSTWQQAERARYTLYIPPGSSHYKLHYRFALVFQDDCSGPSTHAAGDPPLFEVSATDSSTGGAILCTSQVYTHVGDVAEFSSSSVAGWPGGPPTCGVVYKPWSTASLNLSGYGGKTIYIDFTTADCHEYDGHFAYAYIDFLDICSDTLHPCYPGTISSLQGPDGYSFYNWYGPGGFGSFLATGQVPVPAIATPSVTSTYYVITKTKTGTSTSCADTFSIVVDPVNKPIMGTKTVCVTYTTTLTCAGAGTWSSSNPAVAFVVPTTGVVIGESGGTATITYTLSSGCYSTAVVTVNAIDIYGPLTVCKGTTIALADSTAGGTWLSGSTSVATIGSVSGIVIGVDVGTSKITYTTSAGCASFAIVTVIPLPAFSGTPLICQGYTWYQPHTGTGTWSSSNTGVATVGATTGDIYGVSGGTSIITFTTAGCAITEVLTVNPAPLPITGTVNICIGGSATLADASPGGVWSSSATGIANVGTGGVVTGYSPGTATINYYYPYTLCLVSVIATVNPSPEIAPSPHTVCVGSFINLTDAVFGGTWTSSVTAVGTIGSTTGILTGISAGTTVVTYTTICGYTTAVITVNPVPDPIVGPVAYCTGIDYLITDASPGGVWSSSFPVIGSIDPSTGTFHCIYNGTETISYTFLTGCYATLPVTIDLSTPAITGNLNICVGSSDTLFDGMLFGTWSSSATSVATIGTVGPYTNRGIIASLTAGTTVISYVTSSPACAAIAILTVDPIPVAITGVGGVCPDGTIILSDATPGGTWTSSNPSTASVDLLTGEVTGNTTGTVIITYSTGADLCMATKIVTVYPLPDPISGLGSVCIGQTITLSDATSGGTWSSSVPAIGSIGSSTGIVTGVMAGTVVITYSLTATGCYVVKKVTVNKLPTAIAGTLEFCQGATSKLTDATGGGTWSSSNTSVATIDPLTGIALGISGGTSIITYMLATGCFATAVVTVSPLPIVGVIACKDTVCLGDLDSLTDITTGGVWLCTDPYVSLGISGGFEIAAGISVGVATVSYTVTNSCGSTTVTKDITVSGSPVVEPITGVLGVCSSYTDNLSDATPGGVWVSSNPVIASIDPSTGLVTGLISGSVTISYTLSTSCGSATVTANVLVNMAPYITTNFIAACQMLVGAGDAPPVISESGDCRLVCENSVVRYYANGVAGSAFTWDVLGGTPVTTYPSGDSIDVLWSTVGLTGTIIVHDTFHHCIDSAIACFKIIAKPKAIISTMPVMYCLGDDVIFNSLSVTGDPTSPIIYTHWDFGDGTGSSVPSTDHIYSTSGTYNVTLTVRNACGCSDTTTFKIGIQSDPGPDIVCPSIVCDSGYAVYATTSGCGSYSWSVLGGTIYSGAGTNSIVVHWDMSDGTGYGTVSLATPCGACTLPTSIKVPILLQSPVIAGPDTICAGKQYKYSLPLWGATEYNWGVLGLPAAIPGCHNDHEVVVEFPASGTYVIHGWYQNILKLCGANIQKTVVVLDPTSISGPTKVCAYSSSDIYSLASGFSGTWVLSDPSTGAVIDATTVTSTTYTPPFGAPGTYMLTAIGNFCADAYTITVKDIPAIIDSVKGSDTVCLNRVYTYKAYHDEPGNIYNWTAVGGTVTPSSGSSVVNVIWTSTGPKTLSVSRVSMAPPFCAGPTTSISIMQENIDPSITGSSTPCANSASPYSTTYIRGEVYDWKILPNTAGSVALGNHTPSVSILWNNVTGITPATIVLAVHKCDTVVYDSFAVTIQPTIPVAITLVSPSPACPNEMVTFTATSGAAVYNWSFGDGTPILSGNPVFHAFPLNVTTGNISYIVKVTAIPGTTGCPVSGTATYAIDVKPGPIAYASTPVTATCEPFSVNINGTVTSNAGSLTYQWDSSGIVIPGATDAVYAATVATNYTFNVLASNGCSAFSNVGIGRHCPYVDTGTTGSGAGCGTITATSSASCNTITLTGSLTGSAGSVTPVSWAGITIPGDLSTGSATATASYDNPGIYVFRYLVNETTSSCSDQVFVVDTINIVPNFRYSLRCDTGNADSVMFHDYSVYLPWATITSVDWQVNSVYVGSGLNVLQELVAGTTYTVTQTVNGTKPGGTFVCSNTRLISIPGKPVASFVMATSPICETVPINFTATSYFASYDWDFGDGADILIQNPTRTYNFVSTFPFLVTLTITDTIGCVDDTTRSVNIFQNILSGHLGPQFETVCSGAVPLTLAYFGTSGVADSFAWSTGVSTVAPIESIPISESGPYWVTVFDNHYCQATRPIPVKNVNILHTPPAQIYGVQHYCVGDAVQLYGYAGAGVTYKWLRDGILISTATSLVDPGLLPGSYGYQLIITVTELVDGTLYSCSDTSSVYNVDIYGLPDPPTITGPIILDCSTYHLQLIASEPVSGLFSWDGALAGPVNDINRGGLFRVWFTDLHGCVSHSDATLPLSPDWYFPYFATGCYNICSHQMPLVLNGPPCVSFDSWAWLSGGSPVSSGGPSPMSSYTITGTGDYQWTLGNGLCTATSGDLSIREESCADCQSHLEATIICMPDSAASYLASIVFYTSAALSTYTIGTDLGPLAPFSGTVTSGSHTLSLTFTILDPSMPLPPAVTIELQITDPDGHVCFEKLTVPLPPCSWVEERSGVTHAQLSNTGNAVDQQRISNALMVFPNPSSGLITASYDYGNDNQSSRTLAVYDMMGKKMAQYLPQNSKGSWQFETVGWAAGMYIIKMEGDGQALQVQRVVVIH